MTQMESPKRKMQKRNDYQRHKLFRKIKRRRKAQAEAEQQVAAKQLRKKLKIPKFDRGEDELSTYKKQVEMFNDANSDPILPGRLVDRNRVTVNPETGDVMEVGGHVNLNPVIITGKMPDNLKQTINKNIESDRIQDLLYRDRLSPVDPVGELILESAAISKPLEFAGKAALYGIGRYGGKLGLDKLQNIARKKLLEKEFALSNGMYTIGEPVLPSKTTHIQNDSQPFTFDYDNPFSQYIKRDDKRIGEYITSGGESDVYNAIDGKSVIKFKDGIYQPSQNFDELQSAIQAEDKLNNLPFFFKQKYLGWSDKHDVIKAKKKVYPEDTFYTVLSQPKVTPFSKVADPWFTLTENDGRQGVFRFFDKDKIYDYLKNYGVERTSEPGVYKYNGITFGDVRPQNAGIDKNGNLGFFDLLIHNYNSGKDIRIKKSKRGTFTKAAKQHGMSVQGFADRVLRNPSKYSAAMRKKANFARNAASWKH